MGDLPTFNNRTPKHEENVLLGRDPDFSAGHRDILRAQCTHVNFFRLYNATLENRPTKGPFLN